MIRLLGVFLLAGMGFLPGERVLLDAHNCYPYQGKFNDRITRALSGGLPLAIEVDLLWNDGRAIIGHAGPFTGKEPGLKEYFFETVRPHVERALRSGDKRNWPLIVLNINDLRSENPALYKSVWDTAGDYENWLCTAPKREREEDVAQIDVKPVLILTNGLGKQYDQFYTGVPVGGKLRMFGIAETPAAPAGMTAEQRERRLATARPEELLPRRATNFRRWWNNSWHAVELGGATKAGEWTDADAARLKQLVDYGHRMGYWVRFYTLDGFTTNAGEWGDDYNFGSLDAARIRWRAAIKAGVDFVATDHYEEFSAFMKQK